VSFLDPPRCPNCNSELDLKALWQAAPKSGDAIVDRVAIACPTCGVKLRVLQSRSYAIGLLGFMIPLALAVVLIYVVPVARGSMNDIIRKGMLLVVLFGIIRLHKRYIPRLLTVRLLRDNEPARFPLAQSTSPESAAEVVQSNPLNLEPTQDDRPVWVCPKCHEENPGNFNECWKCLQLRPEVGASNSP
jgi:hypothetical protein